jgi:hypothetical protein
MFENINGYELGRKQDGQLADDVRLPPWYTSHSLIAHQVLQALSKCYIIEI